MLQIEILEQYWDYDLLKWSEINVLTSKNLEAQLDKHSVL